MNENTYNKDGKFDAFLETPEDDANLDNYIKPNIETKLSPKKRQDCRDIVREIKKFGVSQRQLLYLIQLLALELENVAAMKAIAKAIGENRDNVSLTPGDTEKEKSKIIIPVSQLNK